MAEILISRSDSRAICAAALELPTDVRAALVSDLMDSIEAEGPVQISDEWLEIIQRRLDDHQSGKSTPIDGELVRRRARQRVGL
jgi:putative addiction module component (TIGR02574 family)